jgi:hypothetical protein
MTEDLMLEEVEQFIRTENYYNVIGVNCTDGVAYLMQNGYSWVVTDAIVICRMNKKVKAQEFVAIKLIVKDGKATIRYEDGNNNLLFSQKYSMTSAKKDLTLFYIGGVLMLNSEY